MRILQLLIFLVLPSLYGDHVIAQLSPTEIMLIENVDHHDHTFDARHPTFLTAGKHPIIKYNPVMLTFGGLLYFYQKAISPQLQSKCPYEISCSAFSKECIRQFGFVKGVALSADRLSRCTQFTMVDIRPSQINEENGSIKDDVEKYKLRHRTN